MTIISSAVLFRGFNGTAIEITTVVAGFLCIVSGVVLLQVSLAAQDKPDSKQLTADLDDVNEVLNAPAEDDNLSPGAAAIRGTLSIRRLNTRNNSIASQISTLQRRTTYRASGSSTSGHRNTSVESKASAPMQQLPSDRSYNYYDHHQNTIRFAKSPKHSELQLPHLPQSYQHSKKYHETNSLDSPSKGSHSQVDSYETDLGSPVAMRSEVDLSQPRLAPRDKRPGTKGSVFKQFSFARGGRKQEEEQLGLTTREAQISPTPRQSRSPGYGSSSESDAEDYKV